MHKLYSVGLIVLATSLGGCDIFSDPSSKIPEGELRSKWRSCKAISNPSRTKALACENYYRECDKRKDKGNLVCY